jgi:protocatechuate 3,4-dioxygenase beta subunit
VIKDRQNNPVPAGRLVLLPDRSRRTNPILTRTAVAVEKGEFTLETIVPGEYTAIAFPDEDQYTPVLLRSLELSEKYERFGLHIHIGAGETTRADLNLTVAPTEPN